MPSSSSDNNRRIKPHPVRGGKNIPSKTKKTTKQERIEEDQLIESWSRRELDQAEILPLGTSKKNNKSHTRNIKSTTRSSNDQQPSSSQIISEKKLQVEIEQLKVQMSEQRNTFQGQADQMLQLQSKLAELQAIQQTLTEKHMNNSSSSSSSSLQLVVKKDKDRPKVQKNTLFKQNKSIPSRVCTIL